jgi:cyanate permease
MPFIIEVLLNRYEYQITLRACALAMVILTVPFLPALKGRLPPAEQSHMARVNWSFLKKQRFWVYTLSTLIQGLGFFFPSLYLPSYATAIGLDATQGVLLLAVMSISQVLGQFVFGYLSDKRFHISVSTLATICSLMSTIAVLWLWGTAKSLGTLLGFSIVYGFFAYAFSTMRIAMGIAVSDDPSSTVVTYAMLVFIQGIRNLLADPISANLLTKRIKVEEYGVEKYEKLVVFTGVCMVGSAFVIVFWHLVRACNSLW